MATRQRVKDTIRKTSSKLEKGVDKLADSLQKSLNKVQEISKRAEGAWERANIAAERVSNNALTEDLQGKRLYAVHFVEYVEGKKQTDLPVFLASSPEWAIGFCKNNTDYAVKFEDRPNQWWYFYVNELAVNDSQSAQGWIATIDWNGRIVHETFHIDKGYGHNYQKDHIIYEEAVEAQREGESKADYEKRFERECAACRQNEKDEEEKIRERTESALEEARQFLPKFYPSTTSVETKQEGDWYKLIAKGAGKRMTDSEYEKLHRTYGIVAGNRILFYVQP